MAHMVKAMFNSDGDACRDWLARIGGQQVHQTREETAHLTPTVNQLWTTSNNSCSYCKCCADKHTQNEEGSKLLF